MQATVSDDGLSFMFTVTERKEIAVALDQQADALFRQSRLRSNRGPERKGHRAWLRMEAARNRSMADQFRSGEGYSL